MLIFTVSCTNAAKNTEGNKMGKTVYDFSAETITGENKSLSDYQGKVLLIVNTASKCGFTPQYDGLQKLYEKYNPRGFEILGFPCNQFSNQEPGTEEEIAEFCRVNYGVTFQMFAKIVVNGDDAHPLYKYLKDEAPGLLGIKSIKWNFTKFLIDVDGKVLKRYGSNVSPESIDPEIAELLDKNGL